VSSPQLSFVESHRTTSRSSGGQNIDAVRDTNSPNRKKPSPLHDPPTTDHRSERGWRALRGRGFRLKHQANETANACKQLMVVSFSALHPILQIRYSHGLSSRWTCFAAPSTAALFRDRRSPQSDVLDLGMTQR